MGVGSEPLRILTCGSHEVHALKSARKEGGGGVWASDDPYIPTPVRRKRVAKKHFAFGPGNHGIWREVTKWKHPVRKKHPGGLGQKSRNLM